MTAVDAALAAPVAAGISLAACAGDRGLADHAGFKMARLQAGEIVAIVAYNKF